MNPFTVAVHRTQFAVYDCNLNLAVKGEMMTMMMAANVHGSHLFLLHSAPVFENKPGLHGSGEGSILTTVKTRIVHMRGLLRFTRLELET